MLGGRRKETCPPRTILCRSCPRTPASTCWRRWNRERHTRRAQFWCGLTAGLRRLDDEDRALRRVRHRIRDAAELTAPHALVAHDEDVGAALLRKADEHLGGVALLGEHPAANAFLPEPRLRLRDHLALL